MVNTGQVIANSPATLLARVLNQAGTAIVQDDVDTVAVAVFNHYTEAQTFTDTPSVSDVVFDTYQTDARWSQDTTGFNLAVGIDASAFPSGGRYRAEITITPTDADPFKIIWDIQAVETLGD